MFFSHKGQEEKKAIIYLRFDLFTLRPVRQCVPLLKLEYKLFLQPVRIDIIL